LDNPLLITHIIRCLYSRMSIIRGARQADGVDMGRGSDAAVKDAPSTVPVVPRLPVTSPAPLRADPKPDYSALMTRWASVCSTSVKANPDTFSGGFMWSVRMASAIMARMPSRVASCKRRSTAPV